MALTPSACEYSPEAVVKNPSEYEPELSANVLIPEACDISPKACEPLPSAWE